MTTRGTGTCDTLGSRSGFRSGSGYNFERMLRINGTRRKWSWPTRERLQSIENNFRKRGMKDEESRGKA